ncbi:MAG: hypothetical protein U1E76_21500 [Planctomycetota bacterium]
MRSWMSLALAGVLAMPAFGRTDTCDGSNPALTLATDKNYYEIGDTVHFTIHAPAAHRIFFMCDMGPGPTHVPGIGDLCLDLGPAFKYWTFIMPPSGELNITCHMPCSSLVPDGTRLYYQFISVDAQTKVLDGTSNGWTFGIAQGDCDYICKGGIGVLGWEYTDDTGAPPGEPVEIKVEARDADGGPTWGSVVFVYDPLNPPSFPIQSGYVIVKSVIADGSVFTIDFDVDVRNAPQHMLGFHTTFAVDVNSDLGGHHDEITVTTCCPGATLQVGEVIGDFTVTRLVDQY